MILLYNIDINKHCFASHKNGWCKISYRNSTIIILIFSKVKVMTLMYRRFFTLFFLVFVLCSCTPAKQTIVLKGTYVSEMIPGLEGQNNAGQLQLSFKEDETCVISKSGYKKNTCKFTRDKTYENIYHLNIEDDTQIVILNEDNTFFFTYGDEEFENSVISMKFMTSAYSESTQN